MRPSITRRRRALPALLLVAPLLAACAASRRPAVPAAPAAPDAPAAPGAAPPAASALPASPAPVPAPVDDPHSYAEPWRVAVRHLALDLDVDFATHRLRGRADLTLDHRDPAADRLVLDTEGLDVTAVTLDDGRPAPFALGPSDPLLGRPLTVEIAPDTRVVHVAYSTSPAAPALQWLEPEQTAGGEHPFLFTQCEPILCRSVAPLQDTPSVRLTYEATLRVPPELMAVMSADNPRARRPDGVYRFSMPQPIPSYLIALAVGDLEFRPVGPRTGVYAEPQVVERAAWELAELEGMVDAAEALYGPYRWGRYDVLVLPPSFPFGGMENPRLTFATPTLLAGDRSLVSLIAHELGHSWSGNLVTNATWDDFWLNEGFTDYVERRIMERLRGSDYADMLAVLGREDLERTVADLGADSPDTRLHLDLAGRDPDAGTTDIAYEKGAAFLRMLEEAVGRERWDPFLRSWFDEHAFEPATAEEFLDFLDRRLLAPAGIDPESLDLHAWVYGVGLPPNLPAVHAERFERVDAARAAWLSGTPADRLPTAGWSTHEWLHFLRGLPADLRLAQLRELDAVFGLTGSQNAEILAAWFELAVAGGDRDVYPALEAFLVRVGRLKFVAPLYTTLLAAPGGDSVAHAVYARARPGYHPVTRRVLDRVLGREGEAPAGG